MTNPPFNYNREVRQMTGELDSAVAGAEWSSFLAKRKELLDLMMQSAAQATPSFADVQSGVSTTVPVVPGAGSRKPSQEQIGQAHFWDIANPEQMDAQELQHQIDQRRAEVPKNQTTTLKGATLALGATAAASAGAAAQLTSNIFENVAGGLDKVPFIGSALAGILSNEHSKSFWQYLQQKSGEAVETARIEQAPSDLATFQFYTGAGKMAGYALPAVAAWEGLGALASGVPRLAWLGRVGTPLARAAAKGALSSALLTDPEASGEQKAIDIALGAFLGGASMWGIVGLAVGGATIGAGIGSQVGDTPEARRRNTVIGAVAGGTIPLMAASAGGVFSKVKAAFKTPFDEVVANATHSQPGESPAEWWFENDAPQVSGNPAPAKQLAAGPEPGAPADLPPAATNAEELTTQIHSQGVMPVLASGESVQPVPQGQSALGQPQVRGLLPATTQATPGVEAIYRDVDHHQQMLNDPQYRADVLGSASVDLTEPATTVNRHGVQYASQYELQSFGLPPDATVGDVLEARLRASNTAANVQRYMDAEIDSKANRGFTTVSSGPAHLLGSAVADVSGKPLRVYHGTGVAFEEFDPTKLDGEALYGPGLYHTESQQIANGYSGIDDSQIQARDSQIASVRREIEYNNAYLQREGIDAYLDQPLSSGATRREKLMADQSRLQIELQGLLSGEIGSLALSSLTSNVRPALLDIKNPFEIDKTYTDAEYKEIISKLQTVLPKHDFSLHGTGPSGDVKGEEMYDALTQATFQGVRQGPQQAFWANEIASGDEVGDPSDPRTGEQLGRAGLNQALQSIGYDGITHIGGARTGNDPHRVWIAFRPEQVHPYFNPKSLGLEEAVKTAEGITKQATVMESPNLAVDAGKTEITEADAVRAAQATNPGGVAVLRGISKPLDILRQNIDAQFVEREGRLDALVGEFTEMMVEDYKRWGTYEGNVVVTPGGIEGTVLGINGKGIAILRRNGGGPGLRVKVSNLQPSRWSDPVHDASDLWNQFQADLLRYMNEESQAAGMAPVDNIWDPRVPGQMQQHLEDFLNRRGITDQATRHAIDADINARWVDDARALDPEAHAIQDRAVMDAEDAISEDTASDLPAPVSLEEVAESKGFIWLAQPGADGGVLRDTMNPEGALEIPVATDDAAEEFLRAVDRTAPDVSPASDVPAETLGWAPSDASWEPQPTVESTADQLSQDLATRDAELERLEREAPPASEAQLAAFEPPAGGIGGPPVPPGGAAAGAGGQAALPPSGETLGGQFQRLYNEHPEKYAALQRKWAGQHFRYTRYLMASLENDLTRAGVDMGRAWQHVAALETARTKADNEGYNWLAEGAEILKEFPKELHRNGFVFRTHQVLNEGNRLARWWSLQTKGYSDPQIRRMIAADEKLADLYHRLFISGVENPDIAFTPEREIERYISHVRQRQAQGMTSADAVYNADGLLSPSMQFFAEFAREGNLQFKVVDTRELFQYYVRSMMFKKYQAEPYGNLVNTWQDGRIPQPIRDLMLDHASVMRFGYRPQPGMITKAVRGLVENVLRVPMTNAEAARFVGMPMQGMYMSLLGGKTALFFRDSIQPLMTLSKVRSGYMADAYGTVLDFWRKGGREEIQNAYKLALQHGWVTRERSPLEGLAAFEEQAGSSVESLGFTPEQAARREVVARIGDALLPDWLERAGSKVNTLRYYGRLQRINQFVSGLGAYKQAKAGLAEYRRLETEAAINGDPSLAMSYETFARKSFFSSFQPAIRRQLRELVESGQDEEAAATFAREATKWSQQVYTTRERPVALRNGFGRFASFLGNFTGQFIDGTMTAMRHGEPEHIARALMVIGGVSAGLYALGKRLGLPNLSRWAWTSSVAYVGSPLLERAATGVLALGAVSAQADNRTPSPVQADALQASGDLVQLTDYLPSTGYLNTAAGISEALQGTQPAADVGRLLLTGDRGSKIQYLLDSRERAKALELRLNTPRPGMGANRDAPSQAGVAAQVLRGLTTPSQSRVPGAGGRQ